MNPPAPPPPPSAATHAPAARKSPAPPLLIWLAIQLASLALAAAQVPFSANWPRAGERVALAEMLCTQVVAAAALFPFLMRDRRAACLVVAAGVPFVSLASFLSARLDVVPQLVTAAAVVLWLVALALWRFALRSPRRQLWGVAVATTLALGGPALWYARADAGPADTDAPLQGEPSQVDWEHDAALGPVMSVLAISSEPHRARAAWLALCGNLLLAGVSASGVYFRRSTLDRRTADVPPQGKTD